ncbi:MAG: WD40 repeat domain-containing protein [Pirellulales bacterium]
MLKPVCTYQLAFEGAWPSAVAFLDSSRRVVAGNQKGELYLWELPETPPEFVKSEKGGEFKRAAPDVPPTRRLDGHSNAVSRLLYDSARRLLISASYDRTIKFWSPDESSHGTVEAVLDSETRQREYKRTKKDDVLNRPGATVATQAAAHTLDGHGDWIHCLAASADGSRLVSGDAASQVIVWDVEQRRALCRWKGHSWNWIIAAALAPDGRSAAASEYRYKRDDFDIPAAALKVWSVVDGGDGVEKLDILKVQFPKLNPQDSSYGGGQVWRKFVAQGLAAIAYSPDGRLIAAAQGGETDTGKVHLLEAHTGKLIRDVSGHQYGVTDVVFSRDGKLLFSAGRDTCVRVCQVEDGQEVAVLGAPRGGQFKDWIAAIALSPEGTHLAAADIAGQVAIWQLTSGETR